LSQKFAAFRRDSALLKQVWHCSRCSEKSAWDPLQNLRPFVVTRQSQSNLCFCTRYSEKSATLILRLEVHMGAFLLRCKITTFLNMKTKKLKKFF